MEKKVNLEEILSVIFEPDSQDFTTPTQDLQLAITLNPDLNRIKWAMHEACRQVLELASENGVVEYKTTYMDKNQNEVIQVGVDKQSITNTINQVK